MINLRYHIVSITAVFLALGIGVAIGSTFIEKATIDTLNAQLDSLEGSLGDRGDRIDELEALVSDNDEIVDDLDQEGNQLLAGLASEMPVVVLATRGVDQADVTATVQSLSVAGADLLGVWWLNDRLALDDDGEQADLAEIVDVDSTDPSRLRRAAIEVIGANLHDAAVATPVDDGTSGGADGEPVDDAGDSPPATEPESGGDDDGGVAEGPADTSDIDPTVIALDDPVQALFDQGFIDLETLDGSNESPTLRAGLRVVVVGGSDDLADDLFLLPLVDELSSAPDVVPTVVSSARDGEGEIADVVAVVRQDDELRDRVSTVTTVEHFTGRAALVLALGDLGDGRTGHYGGGEGSTGLLPAPPGQ